MYISIIIYGIGFTIWNFVYNYNKIFKNLNINAKNITYEGNKKNNCKLYSLILLH